MPTKIGAGGHQQNYDSHGRYCKTSYLKFEKPLMSKKEKARQKRRNEIEMFCLKAEKKGDFLVEETFLAIEKAIPYSIQLVNDTRYDNVNQKTREFDIITKKVIIEVKGGKARRCLSQFQEQKNYAISKNKKYVVYAPFIAKATRNEYYKNGIEIKTNIQDLICYIKEYEK